MKYININKLPQRVPYDRYGKGFNDCLDQVLDAVEEKDVVEVKHGYYERVSEDTYRCSICHCSPIADINNKWAFTKYCGECGAKMKSEVQGE